MHDQGTKIINSLRRRWIIYQVATDLLLAGAITIVIAALFFVLQYSLLWLAVIYAIVLAVILAARRPWQVQPSSIAGFLNKKYPELQESADLLLLPSAELTLLQRLSLQHVEQTIAALKVGHKPFAGRLIRSALALVIAVMPFAALNQLYRHSTNKHDAAAGSFKINNSMPAEKLLPQIAAVKVSIRPPAYTRRPTREQDRFNITVEDGAVVNWAITTNIAVKKLTLIFNDKERIDLNPTRNRTLWTAARQITRPGFYQVIIDEKLSDLYQLQIIKDAPPVIHIKTPKQYTYIDAGEAQQVNINATLTDDYGVANAMITATVAKGRGEGVKFKEYKIPFNSAVAGGRQYDARKVLNLPQLNMEPGDELYFYVDARDTHNQQARTDVYTVSMQDTAELLSMDGIVNGANLKPEIFRSERQIIIDAEQLIKEKDTISAEKFKARSNDLGIDQKLLRLRYGKFLGEEDEATDDPRGGNELSDPADFSNATKILKEYTDDHDRAEDAQFFEPAIKAQLKATLGEMWKAELQLRLYKPQAALPFAYKALRLLKDLQQKSRSYVAKTGYNPPPLKPEKRLSGELDKVIRPLNKKDIKPVDDVNAPLKQAVTVLEDLKSRRAVTADQRRVLQLASRQVSSNAAVRPGLYLPALSALRRLTEAKTAAAADVGITQKAIQTLLQTPRGMPAGREQSADMGLSRQYFKILKGGRR